jgi:hypothetical protein
MEDARRLVCARCGRGIALREAAIFRPKVIHVRCADTDGEAPAASPPSGENQTRQPPVDRPPRASAA